MRTQSIMEKITVNFISSNPYNDNIYYTYSKRKSVNTVIYHDEKKNNFWFVTLKAKNNGITGPMSKLLSRGTEANRILAFNGLPLIELPIKGPEGVMGYIVRAAKEGGFLKKNHGTLKFDDFTKLMIKEGVSIQSLKNLMPTVQFELSGEEFHDFKIIGGNQKEVDKSKEILTGVYNAYKSINMHKAILYGDVFLTNSLGQLLADYNINGDTIRLSSTARKKDIAIRTMIHELAHRWYYKILSKEQKEEIKNKYLEMMSSVSGSKTLGIGDTYDHPKYGEIEIESKGWNKRTYEPYYVFRVKDTNARYRITDAGALRGAKKLSGEKDIFNIFDVTNYARTSDTEFWPEVVATALVDKNKELLDWVKGFIK